jgi:uncharacterized membrane protein YebE (DUF533 family)
MPISDVEVLRAACCMAGLDGVVTPEEMAMVQKLADKAGVGAVSLRAMLDRAKADPNFYKEQFRILHADPSSTMTAVVGVAMADGDLSRDERVILQQFAERLGMRQEVYVKLIESAERLVAEKKSPAAEA